MNRPDGARNTGARPSASPASLTVLTVLIIVAVLYFARAIFIPLALAILLAFLLGPLVARLRRWGLGRGPAVTLTVLLTLVAIGVIGTAMVSQLASLGQKLPGYEHNVRDKLQSIRDTGNGLIDRVTRVIRNVTDELSPSVAPSSGGQTNAQRSMSVEIHRPPFSPVEVVQSILSSLFDILITASIVIVFVVFMLLEQEGLRNRLIRLAGAHRLDVTTRVLDDATRRVSRYLRAQLAINLTFGVLAGTAVYFVGVPDPILWGLMAALLRYIPYLGIWIAASMPAAVGLAVLPGWTPVPLIFGIYFGLDLIMCNIAEPILFGSSTGVTPVAILLGAIFWTWLWGPVGLLLATPLMVCVVVIGRHVPRFEFLSVMLSDQEPLPPQTRFYQRLLAMDVEEATQIAETFLEGKSIADLYDELLIPALTLAEEERHRGGVDETRRQFILQNMRILIEDLAERVTSASSGDGIPANRRTSESPAVAQAKATSQTAVWCLPARDEADELAALMLTHLLSRRALSARPLPIASAGGEPFDEMGSDKAGLVCVLSVPPNAHMHARYLCRHLHSRFPDLKLVAAILTEQDLEEVRNHRPALPVNRVASSLRQAVNEIASELSDGTKAEAALPK